MFQKLFIANNKTSGVNETGEFYIHDFGDRYSNANVETIVFSKHRRRTHK